MKLPTVEKMVRHLFTEYNLMGWQFKWDSAKQRLGQCDYAHKLISMSRILAELNDEPQIRDTILHEIAHAIAGPKAYHGKEWKSVAQKIGCSAARCAKGSTLRQPPYPWIGFCPSGHQHNRHRQPTGRHSCCICHPRVFDDRYLITWKRV